MSVSSDFWKAMNDSSSKAPGKVQNSNNSSSKGSSSKGTSSSSSKKKKKSITEEFWDAISDDDIAPVGSSVASRVQARATGGNSRKKDEEDDAPIKLFQKGAFEDGYDLGDITKTILGTAGDAGLNALKGLGSIGEGIGDLINYGRAYVADAKGEEESAENLRKYAQRSHIDEWTKGASEYLDQYSVLGRTSEAILQGVGQVGGIVATGGIGAAAGLGAAGTTALTMGTMGLSGVGSGIGEAYQGGAEDDEALTYGLISGASDVLTEMLFGGLGKAVNAVGLSKGLSSADDMLAKAVSDKFKTQLAKNFAEFGVKASAEGMEEVIAGISQAMGKKFTYMSEKDMVDILEDENLLEQFIVGSATSGMLQSGLIPGTKKGSLIEANKNESDFLTGTTKNEQAVIKKEVENRVAEKESDGTKLTKKEKAAIEEQVIRDMEKGYISTDTIEEVLGGNTYNIYKSTVDSEDSILKEYDELGKKTNATLADQARYTELTQQVKGIREKSQRNALKSQLGQEVSELVKGDRLIESYNERARKTQAYQADLTKYDAKQQAVIQKAVDSGILNNSNRTHEFVDMVAKISADKGVLFDFTNNQKLKDSGFAVEGKQVNGYVTKDGITLNIDSKKAMETTVGHEITHVLEGTEFYDSLKQTIFEYAKTKGEYQTRYDSLAELYKDIEDADIEGELTADLVGDYLFTDPDFINNLSTRNRNVFQKIYDEIKYLCKVATAGSKEARELERVRKAFEDAYRAGGKSQNETKYSLSDSTGRQLTNEQAEYFKDSKVRDENGNLKVMYHGTPNGNFTVFKDGTYFTDSKEYADRYQNPGASSISTGKVASNPKTYEVYLDIKKPFDINDAEVREIYINDYIKGGNAMGINPYLSDAEYAKINSIDWTEGEDLRDFLIENEYDYDGLVLDEGGTGGYGDEVQSRGKSYVVFSPEQVKNIDNAKPTSDPDIRYSLSDSDGKKLTKEQQEYFKDSKVRDENGNLKVMYHGSPVGGFHTFDANFSDDGTSFFFVDKNGVASSYSGSSEIYTARTFNTTKEMNRFLADIGYEDYEVVGNKGKFTLYYDTDDAIATSDSLKGIYDEFCEFAGVGEGAVNYQVYLNLKNPLEVDANGRDWNELPSPGKMETYEYIKVIDVGESSGEVTIEYAVKGDGVPVTETVDLWEKFDDSIANRLGDLAPGESIEDVPVTPATTRDYSIYAKANGYDGVIFKNIYDIGGYGHSRAKATVAIAFDSNQIKSVANEKPTGDADIRFSLSESVEETKDLMAIHNLTGEKLLKSLKLGGLPMPSVAIAKAKDGHSEFGEISLILPKDTIDPEISSRNKLYSGDAWTPTYPKVDYKASDKVLKAVRNKINTLVPYEVQDALGHLGLDTDNARDNLDRYNGNIVEAYKRNDAMMYAFLKDTGSDISLPMKEAPLYRYGDASNEAVRYFAGKLVNGLQTVELFQNMSARDMLQDKALTEAVADAQNFDVLRTLEPGSKEYLEYEKNPVFKAEEVSFRDIDSFLSASRKLFQNGVQQTVDRNAARELIRGAVDQTAYEGWLGELFSGVVEKEGVRNNKDVFTPSGNRRSFEALHYEHNLENVIKAMREKGEKGIAFGGGSIFGAATTEFSSVDEMKQASDRLQHMTEEEYQEIKEGFSNRFFELASSLPKNKSSFIATDDAANTLVEAVAKYNTKRGIANYLRRELDGWANYSPQVVDDLIELVNDIRSMPTGYFEAKPQRAVGFDEVGVFVIPYDADVKLKQELLNRGYSIAEYDPKVEGDRQRVVNQFEEYKFSLSNVGEEPVRPNYRATMGEDIALQEIAPVVENATTAEENSTVPEKTQLTEENATDIPVEEMRELFPDEPDVSQTELDNLRSKNEALENRMLEMAESADFSDFEAVNDEYLAVQARMAVLEAELAEAESDRIGSIDDADAPPEMDAPLAMPSENYDPFRDTGLHEITRSTRSYSDQNPGARHFLEEAALGFGYDVNNSTHGERWYNDQLYYDSGGEKGFGGTSRQTTTDIADLKDTYGYTWDALRKAADDVAKGDFRSLAAKRVEYLCHKRLMEGYTDVDGRPIPPNQDYINFLNETQANEQAQAQFDSFMETADMYAPEDIAPVAPVKTLKEATPDAMKAPIFESKEKGVLKGQTSLFEDKRSGGKVARVLTEEPKVNKKASKIWAMVKEHLLDNGMVFENLSKETGNRALEGKWNFIRYSQARAQRLIGNGTDGVRSLKDMKKEVEQSGRTEQFYDYLYHKHNVDRMNLEDRFDNTENKPVFGYDVTSEMSKSVAERYEKANPEFKQWANEVYSYTNHLRSLLVENGVISKETADLWAKMYPHYVPIRRAGQDGLNISVPLDSRKTGVNNPVKRATGGNQDILPLFDTMAQRTIQTYKAIAKNNFGIELKDTLGSVVGQDTQDVDDVIDSIDNEEALLKPGMNGANPTFAVFENGERVDFEITEEMYNALKPKSEAMAYRNKILNTASSVFRGLTTQYSIPFMATNAIKDAQDVLINSQHPARTYANFPRAWWQQLTNGKWYQEYVENGGEDNTYFDNETNVFKEDNWFMKGVKIPLNAISAANNFIELTPRLSEYIASRESGRGVEVSMLDAARVTTNFAAGGDLTKFLNANGATFLNASVQGAVQQVRNVREAHQKGLMGYVGLATKFALAGLPTILLNNMLWDDDDEYEELADYVKQDYYVIGKYDDGKFIRIPKGRTVAVIQNAIEQVQNAATGDGEVDFGSFLELAIGNLAPNNPLTNNIIAPISQVMTNRTWYGEDLVDYYMQQLPELEQYDESTSTVSVELSKKINELTGAEISPVKIDYLLNQYSGGIGDLLLPMSTPKAEHGDESGWGVITAPLRDKFTTDSVLNSKMNAEYKEAKNAAHKAAKSMNATDEDILRSQYFYAKSDEMSALYDQKREVQNSDLSDSEKFEKAREIQAEINAIAEEALNDYQNINVDGYYATIGDKRFDYSDYNDKWYEIDGEYLEREQNAIKRYGVTPSDYWNNTDLFYHADYYFKYSPELEDVSKNVFEGKWFAGYAAEVSQIKGDDLNGDGKSDSGTKKKKVFNYINGLDIDDIEKKILRKMSYPSEDDYNYEIIDYLNNRDDISYDQMKTILEALDFTVDDEGYIKW